MNTTAEDYTLLGEIGELFPKINDTLSAETYNEVNKIISMDTGELYHKTRLLIADFCKNNSECDSTGSIETSACVVVFIAACHLYTQIRVNQYARTAPDIIRENKGEKLQRGSLELASPIMLESSVSLSKLAETCIASAMHNMFQEAREK